MYPSVNLWDTYFLKWLQFTSCRFCRYLVLWTKRPINIKPGRYLNPPLVPHKTTSLKQICYLTQSQFMDFSCEDTTIELEVNSLLGHSLMFTGENSKPRKKLKRWAVKKKKHTVCFNISRRICLPTIGCSQKGGSPPKEKNYIGSSSVMVPSLRMLSNGSSLAPNLNILNKSPICRLETEGKACACKKLA